MSYDQEVMKQAKSERGIFERICLFIPGYRGYRQKNIRREVDDEIRREVVRSLNEAKTALADVQREVVDLGDVQSMKSVERIRTKTDTYLKTIETAQAGYSGIWETLKTLEGELEAVMEWDAKLVEGADDLKKHAKNLALRVGEGDVEGLKADLRGIERFIDELSDGFQERAKVLKGLVADDSEKEKKVRKLTNRLG